MSEELQTLDEREVTYTPFGEREAITLKLGHVRHFIAIRTKSGKEPTDAELIKFLMLCRSRELNPWAGDAYLCGYDSSSGPQFSLITAHQALLKRAEACPTFGGLESGVTVLRPDGEYIDRVGSLVRDGDVLAGGWAAVHRDDRKVPQQGTVSLSVYNTGRSRWGKDPAGMIQKVAEAFCLRRAFPSQIGGLYCGEEMDHVTSGERPSVEAGRLRRSSVNEALEEPAGESGEVVIDSTFTPTIDESDAFVEASETPLPPSRLDEPPADWQPSEETETQEVSD